MYVVVALFSLYAVVMYYIDWLQSFLYKPTGWNETKSTTVLWDRAGLLSVSQTFFCSFCWLLFFSVGFGVGLPIKLRTESLNETQANGKRDKVRHHPFFRAGSRLEAKGLGKELGIICPIIIIL